MGVGGSKARSSVEIGGRERLAGVDVGCNFFTFRLSVRNRVSVDIMIIMVIMMIMYSFVCSFSIAKLEHVAHYKAKNLNTVKN